MPQKFVWNKCYSVFFGEFKMVENAFTEVLKYIHYLKMKAPVFEMPVYNIKAGKSWVKTGE